MSLRLILVAGGILSAAAPASAHIFDFVANLTGSEVVPPTPSTATGQAFIQYNHHNGTFDMQLAIDGIDFADLVGHGPNSTPIQMYIGARGEDGSIVVDLGWWGNFIDNGPGQIAMFLEDVSIDGTFGGIFSDVYDTQEAMYDERTYIEVYTSAYPEGEIRGQVVWDVPAPGAALLAAASGPVLLLRRRR